jgi:serine/threonine protein kinase/tetratricopeptide (TPR) repeat protein
MIGKTVSHYKILEHLGGGGMGIVYKAQDLRLDRPVALKFLPPELTRDPEAKQRFVHEARAASALQHSNICVVHDIDETADGQMFIVMEYLEGETLKKKIERGPLAIIDARSIASQVAEGLAEAHRHGLVHRDIKPANLMITRSGQAKILDFGLAKLVGQTTITKTGATSGTAGYMSPEQVRGESIDRSTDIWSLGIVLYEMLSGKRPFRGDHPLAILYSVLNEEPGDLSDLRSGLPTDLKLFCVQCLEKDPAHRPGDSETLAALRSIRPPTLARFWRSVRLSPALRWGSLVLVFSITVVMVLYFSPAKGMKLENTNFVVVADFENRTDEPVFDHSLTEAIRVSLRQSAQFNLLPAERVLTAMTLLQIPETSPLDQKSAILVARREGARAVIAGSINRIGSTYMLICGIIDGGTGETVQILREEVPKVEAVLSGMDKLCEELRENLGESLAHISEARRPLEQVTTRSLQAIEYYSRGDRFSAEGQYEQAAMMMEKSVALDSTFVMAISELAYAYRKTGNDSLAAVYHGRILPLVDRVTEPERLEILAMYYGPSFEIDFLKAYEQIHQLTVRYPNDAYAFATLGHLSMYAGNTRAALEANARAVALYPEYEKTCFNNSGFALALDGKPPEAMGWFRKAKALRPTYVAIDQYMALTHWMNEAYDSSETILRDAFSRSEGPQRNQIRVVLSSLDHFRGNLSSARKLCLDGVTECRALHQPGDEAYFHFLLAELAADGGKVGEYRTHIRTAAAMSASPFSDLPLVARSYARHGMTVEAERILQRMSSLRSFDPFFVRRREGFLNLVRGEILLAKGKYGEAQQLFDAVGKIQAGDPYYFLARKGSAECAARGGDTTAIALFDSILARRGEVMMGNLSSVRRTGFWTRWLWPEIHQDLARFCSTHGRTRIAERHLAACVGYWKDADASDLRAAEARLLLTQVQDRK